jgi:hypothetical protein
VPLLELNRDLNYSRLSGQSRTGILSATRSKKGRPMPKFFLTAAQIEATERLRGVLQRQPLPR